MKKFTLWAFLALATACLLGSPIEAQTDLDALIQRANVRYTDVPRKVLAFYYPWYGNAEVEGGSGRSAHWGKIDADGKDIAASTNYPALGAYDLPRPSAHRPALPVGQDRGRRRADLQLVGRRSFSHQALGAVLDGCQTAGLETTVYYENVPGAENPQAAADDLVYVLERFGDHPAWLRVDGKPVVFIYVRAVGQLA